MTISWQNRVGLALAVGTFLLVLEGAVRVSGKLPVSMLHRGLGVAAALLAIALAAGLRRSVPPLAKLLISITFASVLLGGMSEAPALRIWAGVSHAVTSHLLFALAVVAWMETSPRQQQPVRTEDGGWPSLRFLAFVTPIVIVVQVALGAAYRHQAVGVMPHIVGAFVAAIVVLMAGAALFTLQGASRAMKGWAGAMLGVLLLQIVLGVTAYFARVTGHAQVVAATVSHVVIGAALLTISCILSSRIWKEVVTVRQSAPAGHLAGSGQNG